MLILARLISTSCRSLASMLGLGCARSGRRATRAGSPDDAAAFLFARPSPVPARSLSRNPPLHP
jgi:hypothetical protein